MKVCSNHSPLAWKWVLIQGALASLSLSANVSLAAQSGLPDCPGVGAAQVLLEQQGALESLAFDQAGRLLLSDLQNSVIKRLDQPGTQPVVVASGVSFPGGIVVTSERDAYVGTGNNPWNGLLPALGAAGIAHLDLDTGVVTPHVKGLSMSNGVIRASDGTFYASDDLAMSLDRVLPDGTVQRGWLPLNSNGLALSADEKTLYVNQMIPAKVLAVERATGAVKVLASAPESRAWSWLDGLGIDAHDRLYVVVYWAGEVWRVEHDGQMCVLAKGLSMPSAVAVGRAGRGFLQSSVYVTTHSGRLHEVPNAVPADQ